MQKSHFIWFYSQIVTIWRKANKVITVSWLKSIFLHLTKTTKCMNDYKFHKKFLCFILLIVKFGLPCHAQSSIIAEKDSTYLPADSLFARYLHSQNVAIINNNDLKLLPSGREKFNDLLKKSKRQNIIYIWNTSISEMTLSEMHCLTCLRKK